MKMKVGRNDSFKIGTTNDLAATKGGNYMYSNNKIRLAEFQNDARKLVKYRDSRNVAVKYGESGGARPEG